MVAQSILFPTFAPAGVDTGSWVLGTGDLWLLVLLDHVRAQRAALPPAMHGADFPLPGPHLLPQF